MSHTTFDALPENARVWVFASNRPLEGEDEASVRDVMDRTMHVWTAKEGQEHVKGCWDVREGRFLVVGADETAAMLSGCSVDALTKWLMQLERKSGLKLMDRMQIYYRDPEGAVRSAPRAEFRRMLEAGVVDRRTPVFDTAISRVESLRGNRFELPMEECWHAELFLQGTAPTA